jgi:uncharacterized protein with PIN domain
MIIGAAGAAAAGRPQDGVFLSMAADRASGNDAGSRGSKGDRMRFLRRKPTIEEEEERCPQCSERVPEGAEHCFMCGADLRGLHRESSERPVETAPDRTLQF